MKSISKAKWEVSITGFGEIPNKKKSNFWWTAKTKDIKDVTFISGYFLYKKSAINHWYKFAKLNNIKDYKIIGV